MLTGETQRILNEQIAMEAHASYLYLGAASWCEVKGYTNSAAFLYSHSEEEREHMLKLFKYINDAGGHASTPQIDKVPDEYKDMKSLYVSMFENEMKVTRSINELVEHCLKIKDYSTFNFLQWYVAEQHEEEKLFKSVLDLFEIIGTEGRGLYHVDKEIGALMRSQGGH